MSMWNRLRRRSKDEPDYCGTKIIGTPHPARVKAAPAESQVDVSAATTTPPDDKTVLDSLFGNQPASPPVAGKSPPPARKRRKMDRGDMTMAALGVVLAVTCALFPWYIFFNQEKFGVREFVFSGGGSSGAAPRLAHSPQPIGQSFAPAEVPKMELDFFPTATLPAGQKPAQAVPASEQPFPADRINFTLVHVANGRAMIEDGDGLWVVQRGSQLPDASHVTAIEQRNGRWVLVTSNNRVVELTR